MIWLHCGDVNEVPVTLTFAQRAASHADLDGAVITADAALQSHFEDLPKNVSFDLLPGDTPAKLRGFLEKWAPESMLWIGGTLRTGLLRNVQRNNLPAILINAEMNSILASGSRWIPGAARNAVQAFERIHTVDGATATRLKRGGVPADIVQATGPILEEPNALYVDKNELAVITEAIGTQPCWYAAQAVSAEITQLAQAHQLASRKSHRMIMIVTPNDLSLGPHFRDRLVNADLRTGLRSDGDDPTSEMQAYVADEPGEMGLWCRVAQLTYIGGTLVSSATTSPFDPLILGSAVVHGSQKAPFQRRFERLSQVEACKEVRSAAELGTTLVALSSPERSARMALAGWEELTRNAGIMNDLINWAASKGLQ